MTIKAIVTSEIAGSGSLLVLYPTKVNGHVRQVSIDYNNKKIFYKYLPPIIFWNLMTRQ